MDTLDHFHGHGEEPIGIIVAHILFQGKGQVLEIVKGLHVGGLDALFIEAAAVEGHIGVHAAAQVLQPLELDFPNLFARHRFLVYVENHAVLQQNA